MLQANGRLGTHAWRLGGTGRRLGHTSTLTVTGDLLANSVLARHIPGSLDALYPEAWLEHRMDSEEQVIRETEEVHLTQLTLKLALELSQYFLTQGERSQTMQITSLSQTLTTCLTALETQNRELTKELRQHVERMLRSHQQMLLREQTVERTERVLRENSAHHTDREVRTDTASHSNTVAYEKSTQHTDTEVRKETASHTDTVIRGEGTDRTELILRAEQLRQYTETKLTQLEREYPAIQSVPAGFAGGTAQPLGEMQRPSGNEIAQLPAEAAAVPGLAESRTITMLPPPAWSRDMTAYRRHGPEQSGIGNHRRKLLSLLTETTAEEQETLWRELRSETELTDLCRRVEQREETEASHLIRLVRETTNHEYIRLLHVLEKRFSDRVSTDTLTGIEETRSLSNVRFEGASLEQVIQKEKEILTQRAAPVLEGLSQTLKAGRVQREKMLNRMRSYPEAAQLAFLTLAHDSGIFTGSSLPDRQWTTAQEQLTVLVRKSSRQELEKLVRWAAEQPNIGTKQNETVSTAKAVTQSETVSTVNSFTQNEMIRTARDINLIETAHLRHNEIPIETMLTGRAEEASGGDFGHSDADSTMVLQRKMVVSELVSRFLAQNPPQQLQTTEHRAAELPVEPKAAAVTAGSAAKAPDGQSESDAWNGTQLRRRLSHREIETVAETIRERTKELENRPNTPEQRRKQMRETLRAAAAPPAEPPVLSEKAAKQWVETAEIFRTLHEDTLISRENERREHISESVEWIDSDTAMVLRESAPVKAQPERRGVSVVQDGQRTVVSATVQEQKIDSIPRKNREKTEHTEQKTALRRLADSQLRIETVETTLQAVRNLMFTDRLLRKQEKTLQAYGTERGAVSVTREEDLGTNLAIEHSEQILLRHTELTRKHQTEEKRSLLRSSLMSREIVLQTLHAAEQTAERETRKVREERTRRMQQIRDLEVHEEVLRQDVIRREHMLRQQKTLETARENTRRIQYEEQWLVLSGTHITRSEEERILQEEREISRRRQMLLQLEEQLRVIRNQTALSRETVYTTDLSREDYKVLRKAVSMSREPGVMNRKIRLIERYHASIRPMERLPVQTLYTSEAQSFATLVQEGELQVFRAPETPRTGDAAIVLEHPDSPAAHRVETEIRRGVVPVSKTATVKAAAPPRQEILPLSGEVGLELRRTQKPESVRETAAQTAREVMEATIRQQDPELKVLRRQSQEQEKALSRQREEIGGLRQQLEKQETLVRQSMERTVQTEDSPGQIRKIAKAVMRELEDQLRLERQRRGIP